MSVQDDRRELEQLELFGLDQPEEKSRSGIDATLVVSEHVVEFELKSTTKESVTTVRDFGMDHIKKWKNKHWLFGFYTPSGNALKYTRYASPRMMAPWIEEKKQYIEVDFRLAQLAADNLTLETLAKLIGEKTRYEISDAQQLHKKQLKVEEYRNMFDIDRGYSPLRMLQILKMRCVYVVERGSTLNNPHIPKHVLANFPKITEDHAAQLKQLVVQSLKI